MSWKFVVIIVTVSVIASSSADQDGNCNGPNEIWSNCFECGPKTCKDLDKRYHCPMIPADGERKCNGPSQCVCKPGYYRNLIGECITKKNCLSCPGEHEYFSCGSACDNICKTLPYQNQTNCDILTKKCVEMCYCQKGFARNSYKVCVPISKCEPPCTTEEDYVEDKPLCLTDSCRDATKRVAACGADQLATSCENACVCKPGLYRNDNNECVPYDQCPASDSCPKYEIMSEHPPADPCDGELCPTSSDDPITCYSAKESSHPQCVCAFNTHRDRITGQCIPTRECPPFPCDGPNEVYDACSPICPGEKCEDYLNNTKCPKYKILVVIPCKPQCRCKKGFYRNSNNICIPKFKCDTEPETDTPTDPEADHTAL